MLAHALRGDRRRPGLPARRRAAGRGRRTAAAPTPAGAAGEWVVAEADESDAQLPAACARGRGGHQRRARPPLALVARGPSCSTPSARFCRAGARRWRCRADGEPRAGLAAGAARRRASTPIARARRSSCAVPGRHNLLNARAALAALELAGLRRSSRRPRALAAFPGMLRRLELKGHRDGAAIYDDYAHHPTEVAAALAALRELGPAAPDRGLPAAPLLAHQGARRARSARRWRPPTRSACSTSIRPASEPVGRARRRQRPRRRPGGRRPRRRAARSGGCVDAERAERALAPRLRRGRPAGDDRRRRRLPARRRAGRGRRRSRMSRAPTASSATTRWRG